MLTFFLDKNSEIPLYEQLYQAIKTAIINQELSKDEKLPSKRKLSAHLEISLTTVETAYSQLLAEGYIKSIPKVGFFIATNVDLSFNKKIIKEKKYISEKQKKYLIDFKTNQVDDKLFPYERLAKIEREVILDKLKNQINQGEMFGCYEFRSRISDILFAYRGIQAKPEQIIVGSGSEGLLALLVMLLGRNKTFAVENPSYIKNFKLYQAYGVKVKPVDLDSEGILINDLQKNKVDVVHTTPSHQFPMGIITSVSRRLELLNWVNSKDDLYIIEDDYDSEFRYFGTPIPAMKGLDKHDRVIYMNSFTKTLFPGLRISFLVLPERLISKYVKEFSFHSSSVPMINQLTIAEFISRGEYEKHLNRMKTNYKFKRDYLLSLLYKSSFSQKISVSGEDSGTHFLLKIETEKSEDYLIKKASNMGVRVYGLSEYYLNNDLNEKFKTIVIGYANLTKEDMIKGVSLLEEAWKNI
jgi:GntR family transcriptional regulator/MocR family aminotransferase